MQPEELSKEAQKKAKTTIKFAFTMDSFVIDMLQTVPVRTVPLFLVVDQPEII